MKKFCSIVSLSFSVLIFILIANSANVYPEPVKSQPWERITEYHSYNKNIVNVSPDIKSVWTNKILTDYQKENNMIQKVYSISSLMEVNCKNKEFRIKEDIGYDNKGIVVKIDKYKTSEWHSIRHLSPVEIVCKKICLAPKKKPMKK